MERWTEVLICILIGYVLGSISPSYLLGKRKNYDVRKDGSGNAGATNAFILLGARAFFVTTALDILKAFAAYTVCKALFPRFPEAAALGGTACVIGHIYPLFLRFKGGKGLACIGGVVLGWSWKWFLFLFALAAAVTFTTRYVSLVAPTVSLVFPACFYWQTRALLSTLILLLAAIPIFIRHWENFARIRAGTEISTRFLWQKEEELRRIGKWNETTQDQLRKRGK